MSVAGELALERNLALMAGAGTGKTYSLVTLCLHLLSGARSGGALRPSQLCLLTFTDKAAGELRERLRRRLDSLAASRAALAEERELCASFERLGRAPPGPDEWRRIRDELGSAAIGTFHSLCVQLLRRAPAGFGVDPGFELLDQTEASSLIADCAERVVLEVLAQGDLHVMELCRELGFVGTGRGKGLVDALCETFTQIREEGVAPAQVPVGDVAEAQAALSELVRELRRLGGEAAAADLAKGRADEPLTRLNLILEGLTAQNVEERLGHLVALAEEGAGWSRREPHKHLLWGVLGRSSPRQPGLREAVAAVRLLPYEEAYRALLTRLWARHRAELSRRGVLDFSELLIRTRDLLRDHPLVRAEIQGRFCALLVDEFQDTNRLQLELVTLIAEERSGAPRPIPAESGGASALPLQPGLLCAVGDRKQSIYEFRGADVAVFEQLATAVEAQGGGRAYLQTNRRSSPAMLGFFNGLFAQILRPGEDPRPYDVVYDPAGDDLLAHRPPTGAPFAVERIVLIPPTRSEEARAADAEAIARRLRLLLAPDTPVRIEGREGALRPPRGGDVAVLFRRFTHLETYRQALTRHGIPHRVVRGRGFYGAQEVLDLACLLAVIADPADALSLAAVLRSPLVALSDASLLRLARAQGGRLGSLSSLGSRALDAASLPDGDRARLSRFVELAARLRRERHRLGTRLLLEVALEETGYLVSVAGMPYGEQALANVDKLLDQARRWDARGVGDCAALARQLLRMAEAEPTEAQADVLDAYDPRAVQLLTVHQSKGLEWPVVFLPDMAARPRPIGDKVLFDRALGLCLHPLEPEVGRHARMIRVADEKGRREAAERLRLLYVALTRARDLLVLSGQAPAQKGTWRELVDTALDSSLTLRASVKDLAASDLEVENPPPLQKHPEGPVVGLAERVAEVRSPRAPRAQVVVFPVTHLQDYFVCPRRYRYAHQVGLAEFDSRLVEELAEPEERSADPSADRRQLGTLAHRLLERVELARIGQPPLREHLQRLLWEEGMDPELPASGEVLGWVEGLLASPFGQALARTGEGRVHRELPFLLRLAGRGGLAIHLKGQIDLLLEDDDGGATVVDYKASRRHPQGLVPYDFQLSCYALAARRLVQEGVRIRAGIAFLKEARPGPDFRAEAPPAPSLFPFEETLRQGVEGLLAHPPGADWPGLPRASCAAIRCGYQYRCHGKGARAGDPEGSVTQPRPVDGQLLG